MMVGAGNAVAAYTTFPTISHRAMRLLVHMGLISYDNPTGGRPPRVYFGGPQMMAEAIGYMGDEADSPAAARNVRRVLSELIEAGAVERRGGYTGRRAEYLLALDLTVKEDQLGPQRRTTRVQEEDQLGPRGGPRRSPQGRTEEEQRNTRGDTSPGETTSPAPVDGPVDNDAFESASRALREVAPDRYAAALQKATDEGINEMRTQIIRAAEILERKTQ